MKIYDKNLREKYLHSEINYLNSIPYFQDESVCLSKPPAKEFSNCYFDINLDFLKNVTNNSFAMPK